LGKIFHNQFEKLGTSLTTSLSKRALAPGVIVKYSLLIALGAIILLVVLTYTISSNESEVWEAVLAAFFGAAIITGIYISALQYTGKLLMKWKPRKYLAFRAAITPSNWLLFFVSIAVVGSVIGVSILYSGSSQNTLEDILAFLYIFPFTLVGFSILVPTSFYLVACQLLQLPNRLGKISARLFWIGVLVTQLVGLVLLLISAII
jgi:hypothetical protein